MGLWDFLTSGDEANAAVNMASRTNRGAKEANRIYDRALKDARRLYSVTGRDLENDVVNAERPLSEAGRIVGNINVREPYNQAYTSGDRGLENAGERGDLLLKSAEDSAIDYYQPLARTFNRGAEQYANAMGVYGREGYEDAERRFRTSPGYEFQVDQGLDALERRASARGALGSGNLSADTMGFMQGLADQEWDDYLAGLAGYNPLALETAGRMGGVRMDTAGARANLGAGIAGQRAGLGMDYAGGLTGAQLAQAGAEADLLARISDQRFRGGLAESGLGQSYIDALLNTRGRQAVNAMDTSDRIAGILAQGQMAGSQAGANQLAAILGVGQIGADIFGAV
jgi:hypothetical protein